MTFEQGIYYALWGAAGALVREIILSKGIIIFPRTWKNGSKKGIDLGILGSMVLGAAVGIIIDVAYPLAFTSAIAGPHMIEEIIKRKKG